GLILAQHVARCDPEQEGVADLPRCAGYCYYDWFLHAHLVNLRGMPPPGQVSLPRNGRPAGSTVASTPLSAANVRRGTGRERSAARTRSAGAERLRDNGITAYAAYRPPYVGSQRPNVSARGAWRATRSQRHHTRQCPRPHCFT